MPVIENVPLAISAGLIFSAGISAAVFVGVFLVYCRDGKRLAKKYEGQRPYTARSLMTSIRLTWVFLVALVLLDAAYTARILYLKPLIIPYPQWAFFLDVGVYLFMTVVLTVPAIYMLAARKKLKDMEDYDSRNGGDRWWP